MYKNILPLITLLSVCASSLAQQDNSVTVAGSPSRTQRRTIDADRLVKKDVSVELNATKSQLVFIDNESRSIEIKSWDQPKVKVTTRIAIQGTSDIKDEAWLEKLNIRTSQVGSAVKIQSRNSNSGYTFVSGEGQYSYTYSGTGSSSGSGMPVYDSTGRLLGNLADEKKAVVIYVPAGNKIEIDNKFGTINITGNLDDVDLTTSNGSVDAADINKLKLRSRYANFSGGNVKEGQVELSNGRFKINNAETLDLDTKYATVEMNKVNELVMHSTNDQYDIEEASDVSGRKNYGNLRITLLKKALDVEGSNADIKLRTIAPTTETVKIINKYGDLRLPVKNISNYAVEFEGSYNTVYAPFEKKPMPKTSTASTGTNGTAVSTAAVTKPAGQSADDCNCEVNTSSSNSNFTASVGDTKGKHTSFKIKCSSCTVDFK